MRLSPLALVLVLLPLSGCVTPPPSETPPPPVVRDLSAPLASYLHNLTPLDKSITFDKAKLQHDRIPAEDGVALDTWTFVPPGAGPFPVILHLTPYYPGGAPTAGSWGRLGAEFLGRGYALALSTVRGTGLSGGCFEQGSELEGRDNAAVVEFLAKQPWSNGNVGIVGVSYDGTTPAETWIEAPAHLKTIVPIAGITDFYKYNFVNGVPIFIQGYGFNTYYWAEEDALFDATTPGDPTDAAALAGAVSGAACPDQADVQRGGATATATGDKDAYWQSRDFVARLKAKEAAGKTPTASVFYVHGLQDWNVKDHMEEGWLDELHHTGVPLKMLFGQWPHAWPESTATSSKCKPSGSAVAACRNDWWNSTLVAWFDQFLKGQDTGILDAPQAQVEDDSGSWRNEDAWPPVDLNWTVLHPASDGKLGSSAGTGSASYFDWPTTVAGGDTTVPGNPVGATETRFVSEPVAADMHLAGTPRFMANVTSSGAKASLLLTLGEQSADGSVRAFNFAALSLNHAASLEQGNPDIAGLRQRIDLRFFFQDDVVHAGNRIVLIAAQNFVAGNEPSPQLQPVSAGATVTIDLAGASLQLPVDESVVAESPQPFDH